MTRNLSGILAFLFFSIVQNMQAKQIQGSNQSHCPLIIMFLKIMSILLALAFFQTFKGEKQKRQELICPSPPTSPIPRLNLTWIIPFCERDLKILLLVAFCKAA